MYNKLHFDSEFIYFVNAKNNIFSQDKRARWWCLLIPKGTAQDMLGGNTVQTKGLAT